MRTREQFVEMLGHAVKAIRYRFAKATEETTERFGDYKVSKQVRSPAEIVNHMYDLACKTRHMIAEGHFDCPLPVQLDFLQEKQRFLACLTELEAVMRAVCISQDMGNRLLQGPILDMATHIGQLAMLNGMAGNKVPKENYYNAEI